MSIQIRKVRARKTSSNQLRLVGGKRAARASSIGSWKCVKTKKVEMACPSSVTYKVGDERNKVEVEI